MLSIEIEVTFELGLIARERRKVGLLRYALVIGSSGFECGDAGRV